MSTTTETAGRLRWRLWGLAVRLPGVCPANAHSALIWRTRPLREIGMDRMCRDLGSTGVCWCGKLRRDGNRSDDEGNRGER